MSFPSHSNCLRTLTREEESEVGLVISEQGIALQSLRSNGGGHGNPRSPEAPDTERGSFSISEPRNGGGVERNGGEGERGGHGGEGGEQDKRVVKVEPEEGVHINEVQAD